VTSFRVPADGYARAIQVVNMKTRLTYKPSPPSRLQVAETPRKGAGTPDPQALQARIEGCSVFRARAAPDRVAG
jgi:hypothetical protein